MSQYIDSVTMQDYSKDDAETASENEDGLDSTILNHDLSGLDNISLSPRTLSLFKMLSKNKNYKH